MNAMKYLPHADLISEGYLHEVNRAFFHPVGLALELRMPEGVLSIEDWREDPEGCTFDDVDPEKARRFAELREARRPAREKALGFWQQPIESDAPHGSRPGE